MGGLPFNMNDLDAMQKEIAARALVYGKSKYGRVIEGLDVSLSEDKKKVFVTKGCGLTPRGDFIRLYSRVEHEIDHLKEDINRVDAIFISIVHTGVIWRFTQEIMHNDPYKSRWASSEVFEDVLVVGVILKGELYLLNRDYQIPRFPIKSIQFYSRNNFRDYITLRGCRVATELRYKFIRFASKAGVKGGASSVRLRPEQIPTLKFSGTTSRDGKHTHRYYRHSDIGNAHKFGFSGIEYVNSTDYSSKFDYTGSHTHTFDTYYESKYFLPIDIEPLYAGLLPIIREY
ncbi:hypothetical protein [Candidatus Borreliella tachyglossi]|uniref:hypothetical protein n=1 Tax=Candidatus Borreliella tachyglossi TaxID=1964448 RepID=UPI004040FCB3